MTENDHPPSDEKSALDDLKRRIDDIGLGRLALVAAVVAGLSLFSARFIGAPSGVPAPTGISNPGAVDQGVEDAAGPRLCHPELMEKQGGCMTLASLRDAEGRAQLEAALPARAITMVHPTDMAMAPREVETCESFIPLREAGWGGLSSADMRREAEFVRVCGLLLLAQEWEASPGASALDEENIARIDRASLPGIGEAGFGPDGAFEQDAQGRWALASAELRGRMIVIAAINADDDLEPEYLVEWSVAAQGGTAGTRIFGLLDVGEDDALTFETVDPFSAG